MCQVKSSLYFETTRVLTIQPQTEAYQNVSGTRKPAQAAGARTGVDLDGAEMARRGIHLVRGDTS